MNNQADKFLKNRHYVLDGETLLHIVAILQALPYHQVANLLVPLEVSVNQQYEMLTQPPKPVNVLSKDT